MTMEPPAADPARPRHTNQRGLTLLEVMLGLSLMVLISGGVITIVQSALTNTGIVQQIFRDEERNVSLVAWFRNFFFTLPPTITFDTPQELPADTLQQLQFHNAPELFSWGRGGEGPANTLVLLITRKGSNGSHSLVLKKQFIDASHSLIEQELTLIEVALLEWAFFNKQTQQWKDTWTNSNERPAAVRLRMQTRDDNDIHQAVFTLSPVQPQPISP